MSLLLVCVAPVDEELLQPPVPPQLVQVAAGGRAVQVDPGHLSGLSGLGLGSADTGDARRTLPSPRRGGGQGVGRGWVDPKGEL